MYRILTAEQMRDADKYTINQLCISSDELVLRAGKALSTLIKEKFNNCKVLVCVGNGNNGRDGEVAFDILSKTKGFSVDILSASEFDVNSFSVSDYDIIIDCIFGTGLNREVSGVYKTLIESINNSNAFIVSCDVPSGLCGNSGVVLGSCVKANLTVAIQDYKTGYFLNDGPDYCGEIIVKDIGITSNADKFVYGLNALDVAELFSKRNRNSHKGSYGKVSVIGGSKNYPGSVNLSYLALNAYVGGAGYSNLVVPESLYSIYALKNPECTISTISDVDGQIVFDEIALKNLLNCDVIVIGMGLGVSEEVYTSIKFLITNFNGVLIIDADGLNSLSRYGIDILKQKTCKVVLTPHVGEFARLSKLDKDKIIKNPIECAVSFSKEHGVITVLKSSTSIITDGINVFLNTAGCAGMAKAGSGDVLSGFLAGILARTQFSLKAVAYGVFAFGRAGEHACSKNNEWTITASDIIESIKNVVKDLTSFGNQKVNN